MDPQTEIKHAIKITQKLLAPCLATFPTKFITPEQISILKNFFNPSSLSLDHDSGTSSLGSVTVNVRDPRDGSLCKLDNYPINLRVIEDINNISVFNQKGIEQALTASISGNNQENIFNTVTELVNSKGYKIPIPKYSPWFEAFQSIIYWFF